MEMNHFSHEEHPLILNQVPHKNGDDEKVVICYGCQEEIWEGEESYSCLPCHYFLHKRCAELPKEIKHPMHPQHPLILLKLPPNYDGECSCAACNKQSLKFFTYHCSECSFDLDVSCAVLDLGEDFKHENHEHPLQFQRRPATFFCNDCGATAEDSSYVCRTCQFWIHKKCALLLKKMDYKDHDHSLSLAYSIPLEHRNFAKYCRFCHKEMLKAFSCYYCGPCRYFIHLQCLAASSTKSTEEINKPTSDERNLVKLPSPQAAQELIKHSLLAGKESEMMQIEEEITHFSHRHPLTRGSIDSHTQQQHEARMIGKEIIICDCCIEPIYDNEVFYSCVDCGYFIHATCARLPPQIPILNHPKPFLLFLEVENFFLKSASRCVGGFRCNACNRDSNGLYYESERNLKPVCIKCMSVAFTKYVVHEAHDKHPLTSCQAGNLIKCNGCDLYKGQAGNFIKCNGCGLCKGQGFGFRCDNDECQFCLCSECALLPPSTKERWCDDHPLRLINEAYYEHPDDFYCVMCEEEINPNHWMYHCRIRDNSFHVWCIPQIRLFRNLKFGRTLCVDNHRHPLTHVPEAKYKSFCGDCSERLDWEAAFECDDPCKFYLCRCAFKRELELPTDTVNPAVESHWLQPLFYAVFVNADGTEQHESRVTSSSLRWGTRQVVEHVLPTDTVNHAVESYSLQSWFDEVQHESRVVVEHVLPTDTVNPAVEVQHESRVVVQHVLPTDTVNPAVESYSLQSWFDEVQHESRVVVEHFFFILILILILIFWTIQSF